ncbi:polymorphic outer membrane protein [Methanobacterium lacus]|uniref:Polymorphic outer membrane protein n=1 Tax=Methanobacterium lacus (strain AL-21) TaxID=877455 RepID=F0T8G6_METLA|nr:right-handed parallel beta-helix repeat-containing protein [Methanobacterium lacus]ADZ09717.1 polymorphic outer membrane protein [Methanobacterium lacus]
MQCGKIIFLLFFLSLTLISGLSMVSAASNTVYVNTTGSDISGTGTIIHPYHTIKKGITNLKDKGTLCIANGTYSGIGNTKITINKNVTVIGRSQTKTIINGQKINWIFFINPGCNVYIKNLKITNGNITTTGGAIYNKGNLTVTCSTFTGNTANQIGGAIWNDAGNLTLKSTTFTGNTAYQGGGAMGYNGGTVKVTDSTFKHNTAEIGGAIFGGGNLTVTCSTFIYNSAYQKDYGNGGAICTGGGLTKVSGSTFYNNTSYNGGAISSYGLTVTGSIFKGNTAGQFGGAIINQGRNLTVIGSTFKNNSAILGGGGICSGAAPLTYVKDSTFTNNTAQSRSGGAIFDFGNTITVKGSTFKDNTAPNGGAISTDNGYGLIILNVTNSTFTNNNATGSGGAICNSNMGTLNVTCSTFTGNKAQSGGAIYTAHGCTVYLTSSTFTNNSATKYGGAIYNEYGTYWGYGAVNTVFNRFYNNTADIGGNAIYTNGNKNFIADNNWWGSNNPDFLSLTNGTVTPTKWLVLTFNTSMPLTSSGSVLTADLTWNNLNQQTTGGYIANGTPVIFSMLSGQGSVNPTNTTTQNGIAKSTYTATIFETIATVNVNVDDETLSQDITVN